MHFFICGTDTDVGKTITSAHIMAQFAARHDLYYWKPVQSGADDDDSRTVQKLSQVASARILPGAWHFSKPLSPHYAAELDGQRIHLPKLVDRFRELQGHNLIVEGAGGLLVPLNRHDTWIDFLRLTRLPVIVVARSGLGTINHSLLTVERLRLEKLVVKGIVFTGPFNADNVRTVCDFSGLPCLAAFDYNETAESATSGTAAPLKAVFQRDLDDLE